MTIWKNRSLQLGLLATAGIAATQLPVDEVQAWAVPPSQTFVADTLAAESIALPRDILPGVTLAAVSRGEDKIVYAFLTDGPLDTRLEKSSMASQRCATWKPALMRGDVTAVEHHYLGAGQVQSFYIRRADCR